MRIYMTAGVGLLLGLATGCAATNQAPSPDTQPAKKAFPDVSAMLWGAPVNGLQAGLDLTRPAGAGNANPLFVFRLRNAGHKPVRVLRLSAQVRFWGENLPLEVRAGPDVLKYRGSVLEPGPPPDQQEYIQLAPGGIDSVEVEMDPANWGVKDLSKATASFVFTSRNEKVEPGPGWPVITGLWTGTARSQRILLSNGAATASEAPLASLLNRKWQDLQRELTAKGIVALDVRKDSPNVKIPMYVLRLSSEAVGNVQVVVSDGVVDQVEVWPGPRLPGFSKKVVGAVEPGEDVGVVEKEHGNPIFVATGREGQWCKVWRVGDRVVVGWRSYSQGNTIQRVLVFDMNRLPPPERLLPYGDHHALAKLLKRLGGQQGPFK